MKRKAASVSGSQRPPPRGRTNGRKGVARALACPGDPYVTVDGKVVKPIDAHVDVEDEVFKVSAQSFKPTNRRSIRELPAEVSVMKGIACVFVFIMLGMSNRDIAEALGIAVDQVKQVREHKAYGEVFDTISGEFVNSNSQYIGARLAGYSNDALTKLAQIAFNGEKEENRLKGNVELLGMAGVTSKKTDAERNSVSMNELHIIVTEGGSAKVDVKVNGEAF